jgi:hypothetical protein
MAKEAVMFKASLRSPILALVFALGTFQLSADLERFLNVLVPRLVKPTVAEPLACRASADGRLTCSKPGVRLKSGCTIVPDGKPGTCTP